MKRYFFPALKLTLLSLILISGVYTTLLLLIAKALPGKGNGEKIAYKGRTFYTNIGQRFTKDTYFWSRPSAVDYNAAGSGGSNEGPDNPVLLQTIQARIDTFMIHNRGISKKAIPVDMITRSGSGLDPDISVQGAEIQVRRIARTRNISETTLEALIKKNTEKPFLDIFGPSKINVLKLNIALDNLMQ